MTGRRGVTPLGYRREIEWWNFHVGFCGNRRADY